MARHLHSRSMSRNVSSSPDKKSIWGLPTPPPSLSGLSALASPESSPRVNTIGPDRPHMTAPDHRRLLPLSYAPLPQPAPWASLASRLSPAGGVGAWLALYLVCNLALTLHNKHLLNDFPFPWLLTALHAFCAALGSGICAWRGVFKPAPLNHPTTPLLGLFSILYSANIAASNASLRLVSIATHQVVRAATPLFVVLFAWIGRVGLEVPGRVGLAGSELGLTKRSSGLGVSSAKLRSLTPVILGVVFATYGDYSYTRAGLALTMLGTALAALKTMLASRVVRSHSTPSSLLGRYSPVRRHSNESLKHHLDEGYLSDSSSEDNSAPSSAALHPLDVLLRLSPLACMQCLIVAYFSGEASRWLSETTLEWHWRALVINGALAFVLNYVSFVASRRAGALSMTVTANVKQVLTILIALTMFNTSTPPSALHLLGIGLTLGGGVWYGLVEVRERKEREKS